MILGKRAGSAGPTVPWYGAPVREPREKDIEGAESEFVVWGIVR